MELTLIFLAALTVGIVVGLMPGIGISTAIIIFYPVLNHLDIVSLFFFYVVVDSTSQHYGHISAIIFGVMGETTSGPAVINGHEMFRRGHGNNVLATTATSSFVAGMIGIGVFWLCSVYSGALITLLSGKVKSAILIAVLASLALISSHKLLSLLLIVVGLIAGSAGSDIVTWVHYIFPQYSVFDGGIPFPPLLIGFVVVPTLIQYMRDQLPPDRNLKLEPCTALQRIRFLLDFKHFASMLRGAFIGCFCGAVPGVSYSISSNVAEAFEKFLNKKDQSDVSLTKNVLAAEAANNSGAIVCLAPLLLFVIPILPSESIVLSLAESHGFSYTAGAAFMAAHMLAIMLTMIGINIVNWILSGYSYKYVANAYSMLGRHGYSVTLAVCIAVVLYAGYDNNQLLFSAAVFVVASALGFLIKDLPTKMTFVFAFFISSELLPELYRLYLVYLT